MSKWRKSSVCSSLSLSLSHPSPTEGAVSLLHSFIQLSIFPQHGHLMRNSLPSVYDLWLFISDTHTHTMGQDKLCLEIKPRKTSRSEGGKKKKPFSSSVTAVSPTTVLIHSIKKLFGAPPPQNLNFDNDRKNCNSPAITSNQGGRDGGREESRTRWKREERKTSNRAWAQCEPNMRRASARSEHSIRTAPADMRPVIYCTVCAKGGWITS